MPSWYIPQASTYAGSVGRNMEMYYDLNAVADGTRYLDLNPAARDPGSTNPNAVLAPEFLRPYSGYQSIRVRGNSGTSDYHSLQVQVNRLLRLSIHSPQVKIKLQRLAVQLLLVQL